MKRTKKNSTVKNKIYAIILLIAGLATVPLDHDITFLVIDLMCFVIPLFFAKTNMIS